jgi:serine/threonine protein kinase
MRPGVLTSVQQARLLSDHSGIQYVSDHPNTEVCWIGGYGLGGGSYGEVTLWVCIDRKTRKPVKQCAIKDAFDNKSTKEEGLYGNRNIYQSLVTKGLDFGIDPWSDLLGLADVDSRFYKEAYLQGIMTDPKSSHPVYSVPLWGFLRKGQSLLPAYNHWRLYMPLYDYGDMYDLIRDHSLQKKAIPEPFIWHTLRCLLIGAVQLYELPRQLDGATSSDVIVVFDMKPENILLAPPDQNGNFPIYPVPHIADLGGGCKFIP